VTKYCQYFCQYSKSVADTIGSSTSTVILTTLVTREWVFSCVYVEWGVSWMVDDYSTDLICCSYTLMNFVTQCTVSTRVTLLRRHCDITFSCLHWIIIIIIIIIWLSKIRVHDWSYTRYVICPNNHFWPVQRSKVPVNITSSWFLVRTLYYHAHQLDILRCVVDFVSCDVTAVSSLKRFISRFLLPFVYLKEF